MAEITRTVEVPARTEKRRIALKCDLCGATSGRADNWGAGSDCNVNRITVKQEIGYSVPDSASMTILEFDICPVCFRTKLVAWFAKQGVAPRKHELEY